jgi:hypothetical protein
MLAPKEDGQGVMITSFQSRQFGFGLHLTDEQPEQVNRKRRGEKYKDEDAAISKLGSAHLTVLLQKSLSTVQKMKAIGAMNGW